MTHDQTLFARSFAWRLRHISERQLTLLLSLVTGCLAGLAAVVLKNTLYYTSLFLTNQFSTQEVHYLFLVYPFIGIVLTVLFVRYIIRDNISHGISRILYAISRNHSDIKPHNTYSSLIGCTLTLGFGGSVGPEAPIVMTGSAVGSNLARIFHLNYKTTTLLVACGAAGAISGIFNAPIAGTLFAIEILMLELTMTSLIPLLVSSVSAALVANFLMGQEVLFTFHLEQPFFYHNIPFYLILGIFCGFISLFFIRGSIGIEKAVGRIRMVPRLILGGALLGLMIFIFPSLFGEGYFVLKEILNGNTHVIGNHAFFGSLKENPYIYLAIVGILIFMKVIAMAITQGSGGIGGTFAPALFVGGISGFFFSRMINLLLPWTVSESNFTLVGMAGVMAGVMHAPLTAIFLIAEITGGYVLLIPLIIVASIAYLSIYYFEPYSIYARQLAANKELMTHHKDNAVIGMMKIKSLIETDFQTISYDATLGNLVEVIAASRRNIFPVVDGQGNFKGIVSLDSIRKIMFDKELYEKILIRDLLTLPEDHISPDDPMEKVIHLFEESERYNIPVLKDGKYVGFLSRANVFSEYRNLLKHLSDE